MHVFVHEIQNGEPEGGKRWERQQGREMLEENLGQKRAGSHSGLLHSTHICWADVVKQLSEQWEKHLVKAGLPLSCIKCLQIVDKQRPLEVGEGLHANLSSGITT